MAFNKGDVVRLKSGSSLMTVVGIIGSSDNKFAPVGTDLSLFDAGDVIVQWFDDNEIKKYVFHAVALDLFS